MVYRQCVEILTVDCLQNYVPIEPLDHSIVGVVKSLVTTPTSTHLHLSGKFLITLFFNIRADTQCMTGIIKSEEWLFPCLSRTSLLEYNKLMTRNKGTSETERGGGIYPAIAKGVKADIAVCGFSSSTAKYISNKSLN